MPDAVRIGLCLDPVLFKLTEGGRTRELVESEVSQLLREVGLQRIPVVDVQRADGTSDETEPVNLIRISIDGEPCRYPGSMLAESLAYVNATPCVPLAKDVTAARFAGSDAADDDRVGTLVATVVRCALSAQPALLMGSYGPEELRRLLELGISIDAAPRPSGSAPLREDIEGLIAELAPQSVGLLVEPSYLHELTQLASAREAFMQLRAEVFARSGVPLRLHLIEDDSLNPRGFAFRINAVRTGSRIGLPLDEVFVPGATETLGMFRVDGKATINPATEQPAAIVASSEQSLLEAYGFTTVGPLGYLSLCLSTALRDRAHMLMTRDLAASMMQRVGEAFPELGTAAERYAPPDALAPILRELLLDRISIRNMRRIVELLIRQATDDFTPHASDRVAYVRQGLADAIAEGAGAGMSDIRVGLLSPELEDTVVDRSHLVETGRADPALEHVVDKARTVLSRFPDRTSRPVILTREQARQPVRDLLRHEFPGITVVSRQDLPLTQRVHVEARIG